MRTLLHRLRDDKTRLALDAKITTQGKVVEAAGLGNAVLKAPGESLSPQPLLAVGAKPRSLTDGWRASAMLYIKLH